MQNDVRSESLRLGIAEPSSAALLTALDDAIGVEDAAVVASMGWKF